MFLKTLFFSLSLLCSILFLMQHPFLFFFSGLQVTGLLIEPRSLMIRSLHLLGELI